MPKVLTKPETELVSYIQERIQAGLDARLPYERQWWINLAFLAGQQWVVWNPQTRTLELPKAPSWRVRMVVNLIEPMVRTALAKMTKNRPVSEVQPASTEERDINAARAGTKFLQYLDQALQLLQVDTETLLWAIVCGTAFQAVLWDKDAGDLVQEYEVLTDETGQPIVDADGNPIPVIDPRTGAPVVKAEFRLGDVAVCSVSPFEVIVDPFLRSPNLQEAGWVARQQIRPVRWVEETYGVKVAPEDVSAHDIYQQKLLALDGIQVVGTPAKMPEDAVRFVEYWEAPCKEYPNGLYVAMAGDTILHRGENPHPNGEYPLVAFHFRTMPGRFWSKGVDDLIPLQKEYNKRVSQIIEAANLIAQPKILAPEGALTGPITSQPGEIISYKPIFGQPPQFMQPPSIPQYVFQQLGQTQQDMMQVFGIHEVSHAQAPAGVKSGVALAFLAEQDDTRIGLAIRNYEAAVERRGRLALQLAEQNYTEPRTLRIVGRDNEVEAFDFHGSDIAGNYDVRVVAGSAMPSTRAAKVQMVMELVGMGVLDPQQDRERILRLLEMGMLEELHDDEQLDISKAKAENRRMAAGQAVQVFDFQNHAVHIREHNRWRKSTEYEQAPPQIRALFDQHVQQHAQFFVQEIAPNLAGPAPPASSAPPTPEQTSPVSAAGGVVAPGALPLPPEGAAGGPMLGI